jgi:cell division protein FtsN
VLNNIIEASVNQPIVKAKSTAPAAISSTPTYTKPASWVVPVSTKQSAAKSTTSKAKKSLPQAYAVQVGLYRDQKQARRHAQQAKALMKGGQVQIAKKNQGKKKLMAAQVAGLSETQAKNLCQQLHKKGKECLIIR